VVADSSLALLLPRTRSVHTVGMAFELDLIWLDSTGTVVRVDLGVPPMRIRTCLRAVQVIETPAGCSQPPPVGPSQMQAHHVIGPSRCLDIRTDDEQLMGVRKSRQVAFKVLLS